MKFTIVIPAYNEEQAIRAIVERCLAAREALVRDTLLEQVQITVVSDGSSDRTAQIASEFEPEIKLIAYERNRGYGAAIKRGFAESDAELVGFLDADGTCDPLVFVELVNKLHNENADVCLGSRMTPQSRMPATRRLGNRLYRRLINIIGESEITDAASGMRVIRRERLPDLYPLPDGLHFTPAMSCRAVLDEGLKIVEVPMTYEERVGESKLNVLGDGMRFLVVILDIALTYRPLRLFGAPALLLLILALGFGGGMLVDYAATGKVADSMIFRAIAVVAFAVGGATLLSVGVLGEQAAALLHPRSAGHRPIAGLMSRVLGQAVLLGASAALLVIGGLLGLRPLLQYALGGHIAVHWSQLILAGLCVVLGVQAFALGALGRMLSHLQIKRRAQLDELLGNGPQQ
ncbi:MAG: glycosyltransferase family 2 protein [Candidatus Alcyoniella australis]|nr:glycosyltransferase family 2 protein [Candidatus Alcyoniella australis]